LSLSLGLWLSSCIEETESPQIELTDNSKIATIKTWFEENESSLRVSKSGAAYRTGDQELILPFFKKEPDWSMFTEYSFPDGRKVFEIHIKKLSGLVPKDFFEKYGSSTSDLTEESLLFVEHADSDVGFSVWVARYFSYGDKSKDMTYNRIPHNWSGRIDLFTFSEQHLRSFEVEDGRIIKTLEYMTGDENKRFSPAIMLMTCDVIWIDFPYYGIFGGVGSSQSVRVISCHNPIDRSGGAFNDFKDPDLLKPGGGNGNGVRLPEPVVCDDTNNFGSDCIPFPENYWESSDYYDDVLATLIQLQWVDNPNVRDYRDLNSSEKLLHVMNHLKFNYQQNTNFKLTQIMANVPRIAPAGPFKTPGGWYESQTAALKINGKTYMIGYVFGNQDGFNHIDVKRGFTSVELDHKNQVNFYFYDARVPGRTALEIYLPKELESWFYSSFKK
jgi:hypothetical protein